MLVATSHVPYDVIKGIRRHSAGSQRARPNVSPSHWTILLKRRLSAELNWIKRLQTPFPLDLYDQIYQQGNISSLRSIINVFSLKPNVRRKRRSHGVRRNGLSRRKQRPNRSLDDLLRIANNNGRHELLHALSSILVSRLNPILDDADRRSLRHSDWLKLKLIMAFSFNKLFPRIPQLPPKTQFIKIKFINQGLDLLNISNIFLDHRVASKIPDWTSSNLFSIQKTLEI